MITKVKSILPRAVRRSARALTIKGLASLCQKLGWFDSDLDRAQGHRLFAKIFDYQLALLEFDEQRRTTPEPFPSEVRDLSHNSGPLIASHLTAHEFMQLASRADESPSTRSILGARAPGFALNDAVFDRATEGMELWSNLNLAVHIARLAHGLERNPSVIELGCGPAHLLYFFRRFGIHRYLGVDGNPYLTRTNPYLRDLSGNFVFLNLEEPIKLYALGYPVQCSLVLSFEVLEHIREQYLGVFLTNVLNHLKDGGYFICSASTLAGMDVHLTVRPRDWWLETFSKYKLETTGFSADFARAVLQDTPFNWDGGTNLFLLRKIR